MLPTFGPRVTISANSFKATHSTSSSARPTNDASRARRSRPPLPQGCSSATLAPQPTRKSLDGIKSVDSNSGLRPEAQLVEDVQLPAVTSTTPELSHSVSAASLSSESDLALLLGVGASDRTQAGSSTPLVFGSFPPVTVSLPVAEDAAAATTAAVDSTTDTAGTSASSKAASKLKATSHEFYPPAYLAAAAAATALAARTISSAAARNAASPAPVETAAEPAEQQQEDTQEAAPAADFVQEQPADTAAAGQPVYAASATQPEQAIIVADHQQYWAAMQQQQQQQQQQQAPEHRQQQQWQQVAMTPQQWAEHQQQQWHHWQQQQLVPVPVLVPVYMQPYPYTHYVQQHPQMHMVPVMVSPDAAAAHQQQPQQQQQMQMQVCPPSPAAHSLPADTCSLMSASTPVATPTAAPWQHVPYGSSRPGSSAASVMSGYSTISRRRQGSEQAAAREAGTVTVSAMSCVKDAAGALAKVVTRHGNCLLLSLVKPGDAVAQATHAAAKSLAVARFYINAHMAAAGAAGIDAAAALTGADAAPAAAAAAAAAGMVDDEVVFMPYPRSSSRGSGADAVDVPLGFVVAKASAKDLPVLLPPPVGIPACMQGSQQQRSGQQQQAAATASGSSSSSGITLLKAGANTDVNKLSNAVIHNILGSGHVALQLAGAAACHVAMRSLIKARDRLLRKFNTDIVATASFANEDTSSSIGRSTVFLRLDVMRSNLLQQVAAAGSAFVQAVEGQHQQQQLAVATA